MSDSFKKGILEALIFASPKPISSGELVKFGEFESKNEVENIVEELNRIYENNHRSFRIKKIAGGYQFFTINSYAPYISEMFKDKHKFRLTRAMLEVLSIIAVKQPVTKPVVDKIRNADSGGSIHSLLEAGLITVKGRQKSPGKPFIYATTQEFLKTFGLESIGDIPDEEEIKQIFEERAREEVEEQVEDETEGNQETENEQSAETSEEVEQPGLDFELAEGESGELEESDVEET